MLKLVIRKYNESKQGISFLARQKFMDINRKTWNTFKGIFLFQSLEFFDPMGSDLGIGFCL